MQRKTKMPGPVFKRSETLRMGKNTLGANKEMNAKNDQNKLKLSLVPSQIIRDIAQVREYGVLKYIDPNNWKQIEVKRYMDAFYRHWLFVIENPYSLDPESGIEHYKHCACNMAFICELLNETRCDI